MKTWIFVVSLGLAATGSTQADQYEVDQLSQKIEKAEAEFKAATQKHFKKVQAYEKWAQDRYGMSFRRLYRVSRETRRAAVEAREAQIIRDSAYKKLRSINRKRFVRQDAIGWEAGLQADGVSAESIERFWKDFPTGATVGMLRSGDRTRRVPSMSQLRGDAATAEAAARNVDKSIEDRQKKLSVVHNDVVQTNIRLTALESQREQAVAAIETEKTEKEQMRKTIIRLEHRIDELEDKLEEQEATTLYYGSASTGEQEQACVSGKSSIPGSDLYLGVPVGEGVGVPIQDFFTSRGGSLPRR